MNDKKLPPYLLVASIVAERGRITTGELNKLMPTSIETISQKPAGLDEAERAGLIRQDGSAPRENTKDPMSFIRSLLDHYWVPGRNDVALAIRSKQVGGLRKEVDAVAAAFLRDNAAVLRETFGAQRELCQHLELWLYEDAVLVHDEWQLARDAEALRQPVPPPEPPLPDPPQAVVPPKPKPWRRQD